MLDENLQFLTKLCPLPFNNTLVVFVCLSLYLSFCFPKDLKFYKLSYVILNFNIHMLDENLQFYKKISLLLFSITF